LVEQLIDDNVMNVMTSFGYVVELYLICTSGFVYKNILAVSKFSLRVCWVCIRCPLFTE